MGIFSKYLIFVLSFCLFLGFTSCDFSSPKGRSHSAENWMKDNGKVKVLATTPIIADLVKRLGGHLVDVISLIGENLDPHSYQIVKGDGEKICRADLIVANGLSLEHSASMKYQLKNHKNVLFLGNEILKGHRGEIIFVNGQMDPHIWMDVRLWSYCVDPIVERLLILNEANEEHYLIRREAVKEDLKHQDSKIREIVSSIPLKKRYLVTLHDAFRYFARRYLATEEEVASNTWDSRVIAIQGIAPDEQISPLEISRVVSCVIENNILVIFSEKNLSQDSLRKVVDACEKRKERIKLCEEALYSDTMGEGDYFKMIEHNAKTLKKNLGDSLE